jgi:hypothetical protein
MFDLDLAIADWRRQMAHQGISDPDVLDELESHLRDVFEELVDRGLDPQEALEAAVRRIGQAELLTVEFKRAHGRIGALVRRLKRFAMGFLCIQLPPVDRLSRSAREVLKSARAEPSRFNHDFLGTEHLLLGLMKSEAGTVRSILQSFGVDREVIAREIAKIVGIGPAHDPTVAIPYTPRVRKALHLATREAKAMHHTHVRPEHILLGLLLERGGVAALVLNRLGVPIQGVRDAIRNVQSDQDAN